MQKPGAALLLALVALLAAVAGAGRAAPEPRIVNGDPATADGEYPWTVALVSHGEPRTARSAAGRSWRPTSCSPRRTARSARPDEHRRRRRRPRSRDRPGGQSLQRHADLAAPRRGRRRRGLRPPLRLLAPDARRQRRRRRPPSPWRWRRSGAADTAGTDLEISGWGTTSTASETTVDVHAARRGRPRGQRRRVRIGLPRRCSSRPTRSARSARIPTPRWSATRATATPAGRSRDPDPRRPPTPRRAGRSSA